MIHIHSFSLQCGLLLFCVLGFCSVFVYLFSEFVEYLWLWMSCSALSSEGHHTNSPLSSSSHSLAHTPLLCWQINCSLLKKPYCNIKTHACDPQSIRSEKQVTTSWGEEQILNMKTEVQRQSSTHSCSSPDVDTHTHRCSRRGRASGSLQLLWSKWSCSKDLEGGGDTCSSSVLSQMKHPTWAPACSSMKTHSQSTTFSCWATQLFGAPTLLEDSQRYIPESVLDTLLNFCSGQREKEEVREGGVQGEAWVFRWISAHSPACPCLCPCWTESLPWTSEPCCLCTSGRWQEVRSACPYRGAPGLSPQTQSWARHRTGHEEALREQRAQLEYIIFIKHFIIIILLMDVVVWWSASSFMVSKHNIWCQIDAKAIEA